MRKFYLKSYNDGEYIDCVLSLWQEKEHVKINFSAKNLSIDGDDIYPFLALNKVRVQLEELGIKILCNGCRLDVYPSSSLLIGIKAYRLELGKEATRESLCNIFDPTDELIMLATVDQQRKYWLAWLDSVMNRS